MDSWVYLVSWDMLESLFLSSLQVYASPIAPVNSSGGRDSRQQANRIKQASYLLKTLRIRKGREMKNPVPKVKQWWFGDLTRGQRGGGL